MSKNQFVLLCLLLPVLVPILLSPLFWHDLTYAGPPVNEGFFRGWLSIVAAYTGFGIAFIVVPYLPFGWICYRIAVNNSYFRIQLITLILPPVFALVVSTLYTLGRWLIFSEDYETLEAFYQFLAFAIISVGYAYVLLANLLYFAFRKLHWLRVETLSPPP